MQKLNCVLLIDDDQTTNYLNQLLLRRLHVTEHVLVAGNGREALALLAEHCGEAGAGHCPALILLDVNMPVMNGFEFLEAYAELPAAQRQAAVVVMLTTSLHPQDLERARQLEVAGFLSKPLTRKDLSEILRTHFHRELEE
ncbi:response regulator [uncultured Hymenobacter sp.]|uniref:response regulator n=1 Tax=uncultured Hymenobacter sp. TaxID=170016 RepID=UPI0035CA4FDC